MPDENKPSYKITTLNNSVRVITENIPWVKSCSIGVFVQSGSLFEEKSEYGYSHFLEHFLFRGTKQHSASEIFRIIEKAGGSINAFTSREYTCFYGKIIYDKFDVLLNVLEEIVLQPLFPKEHLAKERNVVIQEIDSSKEEPFEYITDEFISKLWKGQVFGRNILGNKTSISRVSIPSITNFYEKNFVPKNIIISASGNISHEAVIAKLKYAGRARSGDGYNDLRAVALNSNALGSGVFKMDADIDQYHILYGVPTFGRQDPRKYALSFINILLGGPLMTARLYHKMREIHGIAYDVGTLTSMAFATGLFGVYAATSRKNINLALKIINEEIEKIVTKPVKLDEFETIISQIKNNLVFELESTGKRMMKMGKDLLYENRIKEMEEIIDSFNNLTPEYIMRVAKDIFSSPKLLLLLGKNAKKINI